MRAVIPVAGVGTRLRPHTYSLPKVLLNVAGKPILGHILDALVEQSITKATIITGYMGKLVENYVVENYKSINFDFVVQEERLGLGHAIWTGRNTYGTDPLIIILGDTIFDVDLSRLTVNGSNTIGVKEVDDPRRFGVVVLNNKGKIERLVEKPEQFVSNLAIVGLYNIQDSKLLSACLDEMINNNIRTRGEYQLTDALQMMIEKGAEFSTTNVEGWFDCGKPETLLNTNRFLLDRKPPSRQFPDSIIIPPSFVAATAVIERSVIGPYASVADGAVVKDSIVRDSIISNYAKVQSSLLEQSIIGNEAEVKGHFNRLNVGDSSQISET
ncbi:MAG: NTP transferase domain-containing protein [Desulfobulbaceae bacterium]|nr:NTP transferase domain-containing protein [Candidatus Kapabacteria bacterium]MBS3999224.1 NTP transferase domain-containing protein [Desulfobulbaceae bacterium]